MEAAQRETARRSLGRQFDWLWGAYAVSTFGTWLAFDAFSLIAILVLHAGIALVVAVQFGLVTCVGVFNPVFATYRLEQTKRDRVARTLSAWSVTSNATIAALTALWGVLAALADPRAAIAIAGLLLLATPFLLPRREHAQMHDAPAAAVAVS
jgi:hypothetical protein